jgi:polyisoprenoid-binding protein YceI
MATTADHETRRPTPEEAPPALSGHWQVDPQASHARFLARTLGGLLKTPGRFRALSGSLVVDQASAVGALVIESSSIDTGNRIRDRHLRSRGFFDVERHPHVRYHAHSISSQDPNMALIDGQLMVANTCVRLPLNVTVRAPTDGLVELTCHAEVDRVALGIRGARGMVPRTVQLDLAITLRRAIA